VLASGEWVLFSGVIGRFGCDKGRLFGGVFSTHIMSRTVCLFSLFLVITITKTAKDYKDNN